MVKIHIMNIIYTWWIVLKCVMPPSTPQSEIPKSSKQTKIMKLNHFTSLGFQQTLQNSLGVFHSFPLTLRLLVLQFLFTKLSTSTRTSCHLNIEGPPDEASGFQPNFSTNISSCSEYPIKIHQQKKESGHKTKNIMNHES